MIKLNIVNQENSDIKFLLQNFPDGQKNTVIDLKTIPNINQEIQILTRLNNFIDLEILICITKCLNNLGFNKLHLYNPMMLGSRSDRKFEEGSNNYLKDVICPIINSLNFDSVTVLDPHSDVLEACLNNFKKVDNKKLVEFGLSQIYYNEPYKDISIRNNFKDFILISPDAGANKKIFKVAETIDYKGDIITCSKSRDVDGKLTKLEIPVSTIVHKDYILIDDICDGGATFLQIAKTLKPRLHSSNRIFLIVTHGIFSKGFKELNQYFDGIYCTNSYRDVADDEYGEKTNVKQLKVI